MDFFANKKECLNQQKANKYFTRDDILFPPNGRFFGQREVCCALHSICSITDHFFFLLLLSFSYLVCSAATAALGPYSGVAL